MTTAVLLVAHGSPVPAANRNLLEMVEAVRARGVYPIVEPAFLEGAEPSIPAGIDACVNRGADSVLVIPYFLLPGRHVVRDLPDFVQQAQERYPHVQFVLGKHLSGHEALAEIVLERVTESGFLRAGVADEEVCYNRDMSRKKEGTQDGRTGQDV